MVTYVFVEGNIGAGKTTLLKQLERSDLKCRVVYEPLDTWLNATDANGVNILDHFYRDPKKYAYVFQSYAFLSRFQLLAAEKKLSRDSCEFVFIERSAMSDREVFASNCRETGLFSDMEWTMYTKWFDTLLAMHPPPANAVHLYLRCDPEVAFQRQRTRNREEERELTLEYMQGIHACHERWLASNNRAVIVDVNAAEPARLASTVVAAIRAATSKPVVHAVPALDADTHSPWY